MSNLKTCFHNSKDEMAKALSKSFYTVTYSVEVIIIAKTAWYMYSSISIDIHQKLKYVLLK